MKSFRSVFAELSTLVYRGRLDAASQENHDEAEEGIKQHLFSGQPGHPFIENWESIWQGRHSSPQTIAFQFAVGSPVHLEPHAEVYSVHPLLYSSSERLAAKAFVLQGLSRNNYRRRLRIVNSLDDKRVAPRINQHDKTWIIYRATENDGDQSADVQRKPAGVQLSASSTVKRGSRPADPSSKNQRRKRRPRNKLKRSAPVPAPALIPPTWAHFMRPRKTSSLSPTQESTSSFLCSDCNLKIRELLDRRTPDHEPGGRGEQHKGIGLHSEDLKVWHCQQWKEDGFNHSLTLYYPFEVTGDISSLIARIPGQPSVHYHPDMDTWKVWVACFRNGRLERGLHPSVCLWRVAEQDAAGNPELPEDFAEHIKRHAHTQAILYWRMVVTLCIAVECCCLGTLTDEIKASLDSMTRAFTDRVKAETQRLFLAKHLRDRWSELLKEVGEGQWDAWVTGVKGFAGNCADTCVLRAMEDWAGTDLGVAWEGEGVAPILRLAFNKYNQTRILIGATVFWDNNFACKSSGVEDGFDLHLEMTESEAEGPGGGGVRIVIADDAENDAGVLSHGAIGESDEGGESEDIRQSDSQGMVSRHGYPSSDFPDPSAYGMKKDKSEDAVMEQEPELHTVEELFKRLSPQSGKVREPTEEQQKGTANLNHGQDLDMNMAGGDAGQEREEIEQEKQTPADVNAKVRGYFEADNEDSILVPDSDAGPRYDYPQQAPTDPFYSSPYPVQATHQGQNPSSASHAIVSLCSSPLSSRNAPPRPAYADSHQRGSSYDLFSSVSK